MLNRKTSLPSKSPKPGSFKGRRAGPHPVQQTGEPGTVRRSLKEPIRAATILNGIYTIENIKTGEYRTFRIHTQPKDSKFAPGSRVLGVLSGPENTSDYKGFAFVDDRGISVWKRYRAKKVVFVERSPHEWYAQMLWDLATDKEEFRGRGYRLMLQGECLRCGRTLTTPRSLMTGLGPVCEGRGF